jgi:glycosyltransferase involved in cell wall biosynthesis
MRASVILTTYESPEWLKKSVWGLAAQDTKEFEVVVADDGSGASTEQAIADLRRETDLEIRHVWHEDDGFRKPVILNKAILAARTDYLIFTDGDCVPRRDFVSVHLNLRERGCSLSGGYVKLPLPLSRAITREDIEAGRATDPRWLVENGMGWSIKLLKLAVSSGRAPWWDAITPTRPTWNGHNASGWKTDILGVNGFDERMQYGGLDRELGERLVNAGIRGKQIRFRAVCVHLDHERGYRNTEALDRNARIRQRTREERRTWTDHGAIKGPRPDVETVARSSV